MEIGSESRSMNLDIYVFDGLEVPERCLRGALQADALPRHARRELASDRGYLLITFHEHIRLAHRIHRHARRELASDIITYHTFLRHARRELALWITSHYLGDVFRHIRLAHQMHLGYIF